MSIHQAIQQLKSMPPHLQREVKDFIEFLSFKHRQNESGKSSLAEIRKENFGRLKNKIMIQPDFNDPVEGFEEYVP